MNHLLSEMGLFTLHNGCASCLLDYSKSFLSLKVDFLFQSFLAITVYICCILFLKVCLSVWSNKRQNNWTDRANIFVGPHMRMTQEKVNKMLVKNKLPKQVYRFIKIQELNNKFWNKKLLLFELIESISKLKNVMRM